VGMGRGPVGGLGVEHSSGRRWGSEGWQPKSSKKCSKNGPRRTPQWLQNRGRKWLNWRKCRKWLENDENGSKMAQLSIRGRNYKRKYSTIKSAIRGRKSNRTATNGQFVVESHFVGQTTVAASVRLSIRGRKSIRAQLSIRGRKYKHAGGYYTVRKYATIRSAKLLSPPIELPIS